MMTLRRPGLLAAAIAFAAVPAHAQFKEIKAAPFSAATARQKIRAQLDMANPDNRTQVVNTISAWLDWYRDVLDEELIARWKTDSRANLPLVIAPLADARVAREIVLFSWRTDPQDAFVPDYAAMLGDLMERYPDSSKPFLDDLNASPAPQLSQPVAQTMCRILLDMPDIGAWRKNALQILPRYRAVVDPILKQDLVQPDQEKAYRAQRWRMSLGLDPPPTVTSRKLSPRPGLASGDSQRPHIVGAQADTMSANTYTGPTSGTFESTGGPIPQNGEYVFPNIPPVKLLLDFDTKHWEARLAPGEGQTQVLVLRNIGKGPQKKCVVHWTIAGA